MALDACTCGRVKQSRQKLCWVCARPSKREDWRKINEDTKERDALVKAGYCHAGTAITPVPTAVLERVGTQAALQELARRIAAEEQERASEAECEDWPERKRYGVRASKCCECGRKVTIGVPCRCGRVI